MTSRGYTGVIVSLLVLGFIQVTVLRNLFLFGYASCFIYVSALLLMPLEFSAMVLMLLAFGLGLGIDTFYDTPGIHAAGSVFMMYMRPIMVRLLTPGGGYDSGTRITPGELGWGWVVSYLAPLISIHHLTLFFLEAGNVQAFWLTLAKAMMSALFTLIVSLLILYIRMPQKSGRL